MDAHPLGRWIAPDTVVPDPMDPQSLNRYSYVGNRPTVYVDPTGKMACAAVPHLVAMGICWLGEQILQHGPQIIKALSRNK